MLSSVLIFASAVAKRIATGGGGLRLDSRAGQIRHIVANSSPPLRRFFETMLARPNAAALSPITRCRVQRNTASTMKI